MYISKITISNILGIDHVEIHPGRVTQISGRNGAGKTSVLEALKAVFKGGNDVTIVRNGSDKGDAVLELDNGTILQKTWNSDNGKATVRVITPDGPLSKPQSFIDDIINFVSVNPVQFINSDNKTRTNQLLESLTMTVTRDELKAAVNDTVDIPADVANMHALNAINMVYTKVYDERTGVNRVAKEKETTAKQMADNLKKSGIDPDIDYQSKLREAEETASALLAKKELYFNQFAEEKTNAIVEGSQAVDAAMEALQSEFNRAMDKLRQQKEKIKQEANDEYHAKINAKQELFDKKYNPLTAEIGELRQAVKSQVAARENKALVDRMIAEADAFKQKSSNLTTALDNLNIKKQELLKVLPIRGLEIREGIIYRDGVVFDRLNTAQQIEIAFEIASLKLGRIPVMCIDGAERLDNVTFDELVRHAEAKGIQLFVTQVTDENLKIANVA